MVEVHPYDMTGKSMLWLDDDMNELNSMTCHLTGHGLAITKVDTIEKAWKQLLENKFDFYLTDCNGKKAEFVPSAYTFRSHGKVESILTSLLSFEPQEPESPLYHLDFLKFVRENAPNRADMQYGMLSLIPDYAIQRHFGFIGQLKEALDIEFYLKKPAKPSALYYSAAPLLGVPGKIAAAPGLIVNDYTAI